MLLQCSWNPKPDDLSYQNPNAAPRPKAKAWEPAWKALRQAQGKLRASSSARSGQRTIRAKSGKFSSSTRSQTKKSNQSSWGQIQMLWGGDLLYYWILRNGGLKKKNRKLTVGLSPVFQRIGFKKLSGRYLGHWTVGNETSSPCQSTFWDKNISTHKCGQEH